MSKTQDKAGKAGAAFISRSALAARLGVSPDYLYRRAVAGRSPFVPGEVGYHREQAAIIEAVLAGALSEEEGATLWAAQKTLLRAACAGGAVNAPAPWTCYKPAGRRHRGPAAS